jgi:hypothetical protein
MRNRWRVEPFLARQAMHCVKLLGQRLVAQDFDPQVAAVQVRIAVINGYTALGVPVTETVGDAGREQGNPGYRRLWAAETPGMTNRLALLPNRPLRPSQNYPLNFAKVALAYRNES